MNEASPFATRGVHGAGQWQTDGKAQRLGQRWNLDAVRFESNRFSGRIAVADSPLLTTGNVDGRVKGRTVSGKIYNDEGYPVIRFEGSISKSGIIGRYTDRTGEVGSWFWEGQLPE